VEKVECRNKNVVKGQLRAAWNRSEAQMAEGNCGSLRAFRAWCGWGAARRAAWNRSDAQIAEGKLLLRTRSLERGAVEALQRSRDGVAFGYLRCASIRYWLLCALFGVRLLELGAARGAAWNEEMRRSPKANGTSSGRFAQGSLEPKRRVDGRRQTAPPWYALWGARCR
jgi:hypothetical protein